MAAALRVGPPLKITFGLLAAAALVTGAVCNGLAQGQDPNRPDVVDFNVFMLVGRLVTQGRLAEAYHYATMFPLEHALSGHDSFMPWSYPPLFGLLLAPLAALPLVLAHLVFAGGSLAAYLLVMRRLAKDEVWPVLIAASPAILINLRLGQNGLLTGGVMGLAALFILAERRRAAGAVLAAMTIKPHLALTIPLLLLLQRRWLTLAVAAGGASGLTGLSILWFGWPIFNIWLGAFAEVGHFMAVGAYPTYRMTSVYVFALGCGLPSGIAIALHGMVAVALTTAAARVSLKAGDPRVALGVGLMSGLFVSPYVYDYDQPIFCAGLALAAPALAAGLTPRRFGLLLFTVALSQATGVVLAGFDVGVSCSPLLLLPAYGFILRRLASVPACEAASGSFEEAPPLRLAASRR